MPGLVHRSAWPGTHSFDSYTRQVFCVLETVLCMRQGTVTSETKSQKSCNTGTAALQDPDHCARTQLSWPSPASSTRHGLERYHLRPSNQPSRQLDTN